MTKKRGAPVPLTAVEAEFINALIVKNSGLIAHSVYSVLGSFYYYLYQDCISETYLAACRNIDTLLEHENPEGWIITTAKNTARRLINENADDLKNLPLDEAMKLTVQNDITEDIVYNEWIKKGVPRKLIRSLSKREQEIYKLIYIKKRSTKEIAEELGISRQTVHAVHHIIRKKIKYAVEQKNF